MAEKAARAFPNGKVAIFDVTDGGGEPTDITANANRPANDPENWLANIYFHSDLNYLEVVSDDNVSISHAAIDAVTPGTNQVPVQVSTDFNGNQVDWDVKTHNLGYEPLVLVARGSGLLSPGYPVQVPATTNGSARYVTPYVTTTKVFLREYQSRGATSLPAQPLTYRIIVFRQPPDASGNLVWDFNPATGILKLGKNKFDSSRRYLQVVPGGSPLGLVQGRTMDAKNGAYRIILPDGTAYDPIPAGVHQGIWAAGGTYATDTLTYGADMTYNGTFTGSGIVQVQVP